MPKRRKIFLVSLLGVALLAALLVTGITKVQAATPKIAAVAQVGNPATPGTRYVFLQLQFLDGATPHPAYAVFHKPGNPTDPGNFTRLAILTPTAHAPTLHAVLERAAADFQSKVNDAVNSDPNLSAFIRELKKREFEQ